MRRTFFPLLSKRMSRFLIGATICGAVLSLGFYVRDDADTMLRIHRAITTFGKVYEELTLNYVDEIDPDDFMRAGIDGMLRTLDPYSSYIGERENDEIDLVTTGRYGGIGVTIGIRDGVITIVGLVEGYSAAKQGVEVGDRIVEIDGKKTSGLTLDGIRQFVRGLPGTEVRMKVEREGEKGALEFAMIREEIPVRNVTYAGYVADGIGYLRLERFSRTAGEDLRNAIETLQSNGKLNGLVVDLRDNPGGLLDIAVDIVSKFVPESSLVVSTRGRRPDSERRYYSTETPMAGNVPLAILVNRSSASASEIVAGAVQDMDRGVIVGTRTFGKGLVQTISRISDEASLKVTTARYYTPSGRCIQELDYWHRDGNGAETITPDSLRKEYRTAHDRRVREAGGIEADSVVADTIRIPYLEALFRKAMFFSYANQYAAQHKILPDDFRVSDEMVIEFEVFLKEKGFDYQEDGEAALTDLRTTAVQARYSAEIVTHINTIETLIKLEKARQIHRFREEVRIALQTEVIGRIRGDKARFESTFSSDKQLQTAIGVLKDKRTYRSLLAGR